MQSHRTRFWNEFVIGERRIAPMKPKAEPVAMLDRTLIRSALEIVRREADLEPETSPDRNFNIAAGKPRLATATDTLSKLTTKAYNPKLDCPRILAMEIDSTDQRILQPDCD